MASRWADDPVSYQVSDPWDDNLEAGRDAPRPRLDTTHGFHQQIVRNQLSREAHERAWQQANKHGTDYEQRWGRARVAPEEEYTHKRAVEAMYQQQRVVPQTHQSASQDRQGVQVYAAEQGYTGDGDATAANQQIWWRRPQIPQAGHDPVRILKRQQEAEGFLDGQPAAVMQQGSQTASSSASYQQQYSAAPMQQHHQQQLQQQQHPSSHRHGLAQLAPLPQQSHDQQFAFQAAANALPYQQGPTGSHLSAAAAEYPYAYTTSTAQMQPQSISSYAPRAVVQQGQLTQEQYMSQHPPQHSQLHDQSQTQAQQSYPHPHQKQARSQPAHTAAPRRYSQQQQMAVPAGTSGIPLLSASTAATSSFQGPQPAAPAVQLQASLSQTAREPAQSLSQTLGASVVHQPAATVPGAAGEHYGQARASLMADPAIITAGVSRTQIPADQRATLLLQQALASGKLRCETVSKPDGTQEVVWSVAVTSSLHSSQFPSPQPPDSHAAMDAAPEEGGESPVVARPSSGHKEKVRLGFSAYRPPAALGHPAVAQDSPEATASAAQGCVSLPEHPWGAKQPKKQPQLQPQPQPQPQHQQIAARYSRSTEVSAPAPRQRGPKAPQPDGIGYPPGYAPQVTKANRASASSYSQPVLPAASSSEGVQSAGRGRSEGKMDAARPDSRPCDNWQLTGAPAGRQVQKPASGRPGDRWERGLPRFPAEGRQAPGRHATNGHGGYGKPASRDGTPRQHDDLQTAGGRAQRGPAAGADPIAVVGQHRRGPPAASKPAVQPALGDGTERLEGKKARQQRDNAAAMPPPPGLGLPRGSAAANGVGGAPHQVEGKPSHGDTTQRASRAAASWGLGRTFASHLVRGVAAPAALPVSVAAAAPATPPRGSGLDRVVDGGKVATTLTVAPDSGHVSVKLQAITWRAGTTAETRSKRRRRERSVAAPTGLVPAESAATSSQSTPTVPAHGHRRGGSTTNVPQAATPEAQPVGQIITKGKAGPDFPSAAAEAAAAQAAADRALAPRPGVGTIGFSRVFQHSLAQAVADRPSAAAPAPEQAGAEAKDSQLAERQLSVGQVVQPVPEPQSHLVPQPQPDPVNPVVVVLDTSGPSIRVRFMMRPAHDVAPTAHTGGPEAPGAAMMPAGIDAASSDVSTAPAAEGVCDAAIAVPAADDGSACSTQEAVPRQSRSERTMTAAPASVAQLTNDSALCEQGRGNTGPHKKPSRLVSVQMDSTGPTMRVKLCILPPAEGPGIAAAAQHSPYSSPSTSVVPRSPSGGSGSPAARCHAEEIFVPAVVTDASIQPAATAGEPTEVVRGDVGLAVHSMISEGGPQSAEAMAPGWTDAAAA